MSMKNRIKLIYEDDSKYEIKNILNDSVVEDNRNISVINTMDIYVPFTKSLNPDNVYKKIRLDEIKKVEVNGKRYTLLSDVDDRLITICNKYMILQLGL